MTDSVRRLAQFVRSDLPKSAALDVVGLKGPWRERARARARRKVSGRLVLVGSRAFMPPIFGF